MGGYLNKGAVRATPKKMQTYFALLANSAIFADKNY